MHKCPCVVIIKTMKAVVYTTYGPPDVLHIADVKKPTPKDNEVLIKVAATTVNRTDCGFRRANYFVSRFVTGLVRPKQQVMGSEFVGEVVAMGPHVTGFIVGDKVFGFDDVHGAAHAEYMVERSNGPIAKLPDGFNYTRLFPAAEGATYALSVIRAAGVKDGQNVLVYGASGGIGSASVQILKYIGANVTAVCGTNALGAVRALGADKVIDYQHEDFTNTTDRYDFILDAVGKSSYGVCKKILKRGGTYVSSELGRGGQNIWFALLFAMTRSKKVIFPIPIINKEKIHYIKKLLELGAYVPLIDREYSLDQIVEASRYVESGQKIGNVVIRIS